MCMFCGCSVCGVWYVCDEYVVMVYVWSVLCVTCVECLVCVWCVVYLVFSECGMYCV